MQQTLRQTVVATALDPFRSVALHASLPTYIPSRHRHNFLQHFKKSQNDSVIVVLEFGLRLAGPITTVPQYKKEIFVKRQKQ